MNIFYNYIYLDPRKPGKYSYDGLNFSLLFEPYYIGKGKGNRYLSHINELSNKRCKRSHKLNRINKIIESGFVDLDKYIILLNEHISEIESLENEKNMIAIIGRRLIGTGPLTNIQPGGGICNSGLVTCIDTKTKIGKQVTMEEYNINSDLIHINSGKANYIDITTGRLVKVSTSQASFQPELVSQFKNSVKMYNKLTNEFERVSCEEGRIREELVHNFANTVNCREINSNKIIKLSKEEFDNNPNLVGATKNMVNCKIKGTTETLQVTKEEFDKNPDLVGITEGYIRCVCTLTGKLKSMLPEDLIQHNNYVECNRHTIFTIKFPDESIKLLNDKEFYNLRESMLLSNNALNTSYKLNKPVENSLEFFNKRLNARIKNSIGFQILHKEIKLF